MKQPRSTRNERKAAQASDNLITNVGDTVKQFAGGIVQALDAIAKKGLGASDCVVGLIEKKLEDGTSSHLLFVKGKALSVAELSVTNPPLAAAVDAGLPCGHVMLLVALPSGTQGCCPECDYDVRGRLGN